jgi:uncharacterized membrane protein
MTQRGDQVGGVLPLSLFTIASRYQGIEFSEGARLSNSTIKESMDAPLDESRTTFYNAPYGTSPVPYIPFVLGIWISKFFNSNPVYLLWGARIAGLISFLGIVFFAIKIIPIHKYAMFAVALSPMTLYQAASVSYDGLSIALSFLMLALVLRFAYTGTVISNKALAVFLVVAVFHRYMKDGYFLLPFLMFLVPAKKIGSITRVAAIFLTLCAVYFLPRYTWGEYVSSLNLHGGAIFMNDFLYDMGKQITFYAQRPLQFVEYLSLNIMDQGSEWIVGALGRFGYSYTPLSVPVVFIHGLSLIALSVLDSSPLHPISLRQKFIVSCVAFGTIGIIVVGVFLNSPVGARRIFGLQGRYFIPILPLLLLLNYNPCFSSRFWEQRRNVIVPAYCVLLLSYTVYFINHAFYAQ